MASPWCGNIKAMTMTCKLTFIGVAVKFTSNIVVDGSITIKEDIKIIKYKK